MVEKCFVSSALCHLQDRRSDLQFGQSSDALLSEHVFIDQDSRAHNDHPSIPSSGGCGTVNIDSTKRA